jgi:hypothetical protein
LLTAQIPSVKGISIRIFELPVCRKPKGNKSSYAKGEATAAAARIVCFSPAIFVVAALSVDGFGSPSESTQATSATSAESIHFLSMDKMLFRQCHFAPAVRSRVAFLFYGILGNERPIVKRRA